MRFLALHFVDVKTFAVSWVRELKFGFSQLKLLWELVWKLQRSLQRFFMFHWHFLYFWDCRKLWFAEIPKPQTIKSSKKNKIFYPLKNYYSEGLENSSICIKLSLIHLESEISHTHTWNLFRITSKVFLTREKK
jgi:hypothetical protein